MTKKERFERAQKIVANAEIMMGNIPTAAKITMTIAFAEGLAHLEKGGYADVFVARNDGKRYESQICG